MVGWLRFDRVIEEAIDHVVTDMDKFLVLIYDSRCEDGGRKRRRKLDGSLPEGNTFSFLIILPKLKYR